MDWTSVFVEDGNEDLIIPQLMEKNPTTSRLTRLMSKLYHHYEEDCEGDVGDLSDGHRLMEFADDDHYTESAYSLRALYFLSINYILGVGCLGIPYAFARAGFILCSCILLTVTLFSYMTVMWVAESGIRFETQMKSRSSSKTEMSPLLLQQKTNFIQNGRYEVIDLVDFYLGKCQKVIYQISLMALMYIGLLAYSQVFCGAIAAMLWGSGDIAWAGIPQIFFGLMVIPLSCMELDEQVAIQALMAGARFVAIFIIAFGSIAALYMDDSHSNSSHPPYFAAPETEECAMSYTSCFSGFGVAFSTSLFSQLFQHSVPGLLRPLKEQRDKLKKVPRTLGASLLTTSSLYLLLGTTSASYFGAQTRSSINLNFAYFNFGVDLSTTPPLFNFLLHVASNTVVVFPALETISVFPLIANTLGNNLYASAGGGSIKYVARRIAQYRAWLRGKSSVGKCSDEAYNLLSMDEKKQELQTASKVASIFWRLVAALPPLLGSLVASDLSFSLLLAGVAGIHVAFLAPSMLQLRSSRLLEGSNIYSGWYSRTIFCFPVLVFATFSLGVVVFQIRDAVMAGL